MGEANLSRALSGKEVRPDKGGHAVAFETSLDAQESAKRLGVA